MEINLHSFRRRIRNIRKTIASNRYLKTSERRLFSVLNDKILILDCDRNIFYRTFFTISISWARFSHN